jgi:hypothetical protein
VSNTQNIGPKITQDNFRIHNLYSICAQRSLLIHNVLDLLRIIHRGLITKPRKDGIHAITRNIIRRSIWRNYPIHLFPLQRLAAIQNTQHDETTEGQFANGGRLVDNVEANRLQIFFPGDSLGIDPPRTQA